MTAEELKIPIEDKKEIAKQINSILKIFNDYNPVVWYANKTNRIAIEALIEKMWFEESKNIVNTAIEIQGKDYAPVITNPYELRVKMPKLINFLNKNVCQ